MNHLAPLVRRVARRFAALAACAMLSAGVAAAQEIASFYIREYRVEGAGRLQKLEVEQAVYPFLG
ncbi:MAG: hypothetical protein WCJ14_07785, partial [Verrucomicrobiota bacterium]